MSRPRVVSIRHRDVIGIRLLGECEMHDDPRARLGGDESSEEKLAAGGGDRPGLLTGEKVPESNKVSPEGLADTPRGGHDGAQQ